MRKLLSISLVSLLLLSSIGVTIHKHYCGSELMATTIFFHDDGACNDEMPMKDGSCQDKHIHYSVDSPMDSFEAVSSIVVPFEWSVGYAVTIDVSIVSQKLTYSKFSIRNSPPIPEPNIYTRDQAFLL